MLVNEQRDQTWVGKVWSGLVNVNLPRITVIAAGTMTYALLASRTKYNMQALPFKPLPASAALACVAGLQVLGSSANPFFPSPVSKLDLTGQRGSNGHHFMRNISQDVIYTFNVCYNAAVPVKVSTATGSVEKANLLSTASGQRRILIMMSDTGGGHRASAEAIRAAFGELYGSEKYKVSIVDLWKEHTPWPFNYLPDSYSFLVKYSILWRIVYHLTNPTWIHVPYFRLVELACKSHLEEAFEMYRPHLFVSVHPLMQHIPLRIANRMMDEGRLPPAAFVTVVTDFTTCHNTWFHKDVTRCYVATEYTEDLARQNGLAEKKVRVYGLPIRPEFSKPKPPQHQLRLSLGLDPHLPTLLLVGGGEGMGRLHETVVELDKKLGARCQVVVVCGRNTTLLSRLQSWQPPNCLKIVPLGFVSNMHDYMAAADAVITKAGPGTIAEALISGLPILLNGNIPCQEEGNIPYVVENGVGAFETDPSKIATIVERWLAEDGRELKRLAARSAQLGQPMAVYNITRELAELAGEAEPMPTSAVVITSGSPESVAPCA